MLSNRRRSMGEAIQELTNIYRYDYYNTWEDVYKKRQDIVEIVKDHWETRPIACELISNALKSAELHSLSKPDAPEKLLSIVSICEYIDPDATFRRRLLDETLSILDRSEDIIEENRIGKHEGIHSVFARVSAQDSQEHAVLLSNMLANSLIEYFRDNLPDNQYEKNRVRMQFERLDQSTTAPNSFVDRFDTLMVDTLMKDWEINKTQIQPAV